MPVTLVSRRSKNALPVYCVARGELAASEAGVEALAWAKANGFDGEPGRTLVIPGENGSVAGAFFGVEPRRAGFSPLIFGKLAKALPAGEWYFAASPSEPDLAVLGLTLGGYVFDRYRKSGTADLRVIAPKGADAGETSRVASGVFLTRDLINTPANDMGPEGIEKAARKLARAHKAQISVIKGEALISRNFPMIHAVGRASAEAPRLIDMRWGPKDAPKVTLVGKGVAFDTGGLDIKPPSSMLLMKKDMGGAANVLGLASMIMAAGRKVRLRVLVPAVENAISANAFRPGDILKSRKGITVEVGNTDAEGRLVLADALAYADEEKPDLLIDMATLTGAARVALGPDLPPFFTDDEELAGRISRAAEERADPVWRMPLWSPYDSRYSSRVADINNISSDSFAGAIIAALFLRRFVEKAKGWAHFDVFGWSPLERPHCPVGGEAQAIRALDSVIAKHYAG
ncbi:leucyl aminopeptidase family protein [Mesorhizobium sp. Z1-4]|uniref:leucyl aminopeptidase family protein n=1 Tax=Mesorhizobium sp. Z1-4 TaxID=2448478 RepID=UPI000FD6D51A|nr:leucyl aminopeptidase family protein [Mesorhizobium sp. Z1-4]